MKLSEFASALLHAKEKKYLINHLNYFLSLFDFTAFSFTLYSEHTKTGRKLKFEYASNALRPWHDHYLANKYADVDKTLEESNCSVLPVLWDVNEQLACARHNRELLIRQESIQYGIDKGLSLPVYGPNFDFAVLVLHQLMGQNNLLNYQKEQFTWLNAAKIFYHYLAKMINHEIFQKNRNENILSQREEQCLALVKKNWRVDQIANDLGITIRTVQFHIQNANKKLGTRNKYFSALKYFQ